MGGGKKAGMFAELRGRIADLEELNATLLQAGVRYELTLACVIHKLADDDAVVLSGAERDLAFKEAWGITSQMIDDPSRPMIVKVRRHLQRGGKDAVVR